MSHPTDFDATKERILAEFRTKGFGPDAIPVDKAIELRRYASLKLEAIFPPKT
jgi:hypothetical protein